MEGQLGILLQLEPELVPIGWDKLETLEEHNDPA